MILKCVTCDTTGCKGIWYCTSPSDILIFQTQYFTHWTLCFFRSRGNENTCMWRVVTPEKNGASTLLKRFPSPEKKSSVMTENAYDASYAGYPYCSNSLHSKESWGKEFPQVTVVTIDSCHPYPYAWQSIYRKHVLCIML